MIRLILADLICWGFATWLLFTNDWKIIAAVVGAFGIVYTLNSIRKMIQTVRADMAIAAFLESDEMQQMMDQMMDQEGNGVGFIRIDKKEDGLSPEQLKRFGEITPEQAAKFEDEDNKDDENSL